ncbi:MAG TPA: hypothetical protein VHS78_10185 [Candidatus Elarobacter sp.]|jgi:tRNA G10  N-methylase Trm11|nr:hypothetical protein [Candidatus Elarobacter sp.]
MIAPSREEGEVVHALPTSGLHGRLFRFAAGAAREAAELNHSLHKYPAKFIPHIPRWAIEYAGLKQGQLVVDPFVGSGTTLVEGMVRGLRAFGSDVSPLARLITRAKCGVWEQPVERTLSQIAELELAIRSSDSESALARNERTLHDTWTYWFTRDAMGRLVSIRECIAAAALGASSGERDAMQAFLLVALSETAKKVSYLDERQIKVRYHADKFANGVPDAADIFLAWVRKFVPRQYEFSRLVRSAGGDLVGLGTDARSLPLVPGSVDAIISSPPYINAIDYTMAHKYNLFLLDLVEPKAFKEHCREYIGVTERAITTAMVQQIPGTGHAWTDSFVAQLASGSAVDKNRAYILGTYFAGMRHAFREAHRVMREGSLFILALGQSNRIRGRYVPTSNILAEIATDCGFEVVEQFFHGVERRRIKFNRNSTAGIIDNECVLVLKANG